MCLMQISNYIFNHKIINQWKYKIHSNGCEINKQYAKHLDLA